ncbi:phage tail tube protein, partial [Zhenhengia yiwuensis]
DIQVTNEDPTSSIGAQTVLLKDCNLDSVVLASFDVDADVLEEDLDFTFSDADLLEKFKKPTLG